MSVSVHIEGGDALAARLGIELRKIEKAVADGVNETALNVQTAAKRNAPVDTGRLRSSIGMDQVATNANPVAIVAAHTDYAEHVEYGTTRMSAQPYMTPALEVEAPRLESHIKKRIT